MASNYHIQKPYVLASLPQSLAQPDRSCVVGEVYGQRPGIKKRRRPEVAVGIDGEATNIYDVSSSRLITSYPIPPQARFSCPPCSIRMRAAARKGAATARYTYIATREPARKMSLFKDTVDASGTTASATVTASLGRTDDVIAIHTLSMDGTAADPGSETGALVAPDLVAVGHNGTVTCFDGETLQEKYKTSVEALSKDLLPRGSTVAIELAQMSHAADVLKGLALGDGFLNGLLGPATDSGSRAGQSDVLMLVTAVSDRQGGRTRYLHVLVVDEARAIQVHHVRLPPWTTGDEPRAVPPVYRLDTASGVLAALEGESVVVYNLARSIPRISSTIVVPGATSLLRLSASSVLVASATVFSVYNPVLKSLQASAALDPPSAKNAVRTSTLVSFFPQLDLAVGLVDSSLVAVQLEPPRTRSKKRRADGLLIDSIGRGVVREDDLVVAESVAELPKTSLPGTVSAEYLAQSKADAQTADKLLEAGDLVEFDAFLAERLGIQHITDWHWQRPLDVEDRDAGGDAMEVTGDETVEAQGYTSQGAPAKTRYPEADRRWVVYAISRLLAIDASSEKSGLQLQCKHPKSEILNYLVDAGHLSVANVLSALRHTLGDMDDDGVFLGEALPVLLAHVDPSLDLLVRWLYETRLGAVELLSAVLLLMRSLELVANSESAPETLVHGDTTRGMTTATATTTTDGATAHGDDNTLVGQGELDRLDEQLQLAEFFLQHVENDPRDLALDIAIGRLGGCPAVTTVQGLRRIFKTDEIRALIEVLRKQLVDQGWATRYVDMLREDSHSDEEDEKEAVAPLNHSIRLIADLLCRCIDAVRPGEWLINDEIVLFGDDGSYDGDEVGGGEGSVQSGDFFASLKWQVSAALEGVQETLYLRGVVGEAVRYAMAVQSASAGMPSSGTRGTDTEVGAVVTVPTPGSGMLPLGLKAPVPGSLLRLHGDVTATKVVSGGEVVKRSRRELGHLTSKKVGAYTLERIVL